jgi:hypothetical protein
MSRAAYIGTLGRALSHDRSLLNMALNFRGAQLGR